jgi:hypothetical protein
MANDDTSGYKSRPLSDPGNPLLWIAVATLLGFAAFAGYMVSASGDGNATRWDHLVYVFGSVEAIAFAAAGALFGSQVQRQQTEQARDDAKQARGDADANKTGAANGLALAHATVAMHEHARSLRAPEESLQPPGLDQLAAMAQSLFPVTAPGTTAT